MVRMSRIKGRTDDMLIIRGVNVFPSEIERVVLRHEELEPHYQIVLTRQHAMDRLIVRAELTPHLYADLGATLANDMVSRVAERLASQLRETLALSAGVEICAPGTIPRSEGKAVRVLDRR